MSTFRVSSHSWTWSSHFHPPSFRLFLELHWDPLFQLLWWISFHSSSSFHLLIHKRTLPFDSEDCLLGSHSFPVSLVFAFQRVSSVNGSKKRLELGYKKSSSTDLFHLFPSLFLSWNVNITRWLVPCCNPHETGTDSNRKIRQQLTDWTISSSSHYWTDENAWEEILTGEKITSDHLLLLFVEELVGSESSSHSDTDHWQQLLIFPRLLSKSSFLPPSPLFSFSWWLHLWCKFPVTIVWSVTS